MHVRTGDTKTGKILYQLTDCLPMMIGSAGGPSPRTFAVEMVTLMLLNVEVEQMSDGR